MRELALCQLVAIWKHTNLVSFSTPRYKRGLTYCIFLTCRKTISEHTLMNLPIYSHHIRTLILMHALKGFFLSFELHTYTARFLLQPRELDTSDVAMLYSMLFNSSNDWKKDLGWIIRFLSDGMMSTKDWRVLKQRHTWELLASLYKSSETDTVLRRSLLKVGSFFFFFFFALLYLCRSFTSKMFLQI